MSAWTLLELAAHLEATSRDIDSAIQATVEAGAVIIKTNAQTAIGTYHYGWPSLAASTLARKSANTPLLETGELRDSIAITMGYHEAWIGTSHFTAKWHEFGTSKMPARPFMAPAALESIPLIQKVAKRNMAAAFAGRGSFAKGWGDAFKAAKIIYDLGKKSFDLIHDL
jgi:HK97 gp10 family phage protein